MKIKLLMMAMVFLIVSAGCASTTILDEHPNYKPLIGKKYRLLIDCYFASYGSSSSNQFVMPPGILGVPKQCNDSFLGKTYNNKTLIGIVKKGSILKINSIKSEVSFESQSFIIDIKFSNDSSAKIYDGTWLFDDSNGKLTPLKDYIAAEETPGQSSAEQ